MTIVVLAVLVAVWLAPATLAQARRGAAPRATAVRTEPLKFECPSVLGVGVRTKAVYCDVLAGRNAVDGTWVDLPARTGVATLRFDLHNRHLYSEELIKSGRGYRGYTATIGVMSEDNTLLSRFVVQNEFRTAADLVERIAADQGSGTKAVAPTGVEHLTLVIPANTRRISVVGEKLTVVSLDAPGTFNTPGRPVALISNVTFEYRPAAGRQTPRR